MASARWAKDRERRNQLAALSAELCMDRIVRRIVVIDHERDVREVVIRAWDSEREWRRKERKILAR